MSKSKEKGKNKKGKDKDKDKDKCCKKYQTGKGCKACPRSK